MQVTRELANSATRVLTCAPLDCTREADCFELAKYVRAAEKRYGVMDPPPQPEPDPGEILAGLKIGDPVLLVTPCGVHQAAVEDFKDGRLWILWVLGHGCDLGHSATWVNPLTGDNCGGDYRIEPAADVVKREAFND